jgi:hypothetical protein
VNFTIRARHVLSFPAEADALKPPVFMIEPHYDGSGQLEEDSNLLGSDELPPL